MEQQQYYLTDRINDRTHCYCKDRQWRGYIECEQNNWQDVLVGDSKQIFDIKYSLTTQNQRWGFEKDDKCVRSITQRMVFAKLKWDDGNDVWEVTGKVLAEGYYEACRMFKVDCNYPGKGISVIHYSDVYRYEIAEASG